MARKKKEKEQEYEDEYLSKDELKNYDEDDYRLETKWEVFVRNYKNAPGFRALVKLSIYILLIIVLIVMVNIKNVSTPSKNEDTTEPTTEVTVKFNDMLEELLSNKQYKCEININDQEYILNGLYGNNILTGNLYTPEATYSYKLKDDVVYEIKLKKEVENNDLFANINKKFIHNGNLVNVIKHASGIKVENGVKYNKVKVDDILYNIDITIKDNHIKTIDITSEGISYKFTYDETFLID